MMVSEGDVEVTVSWVRPVFPNGILTGYTVSVQHYEGGSAISPVTVSNNTLSTVLDVSSLGMWSTLWHEIYIPLWSLECAIVVLECGIHMTYTFGFLTQRMVYHIL